MSEDAQWLTEDQLGLIKEVRRILQSGHGVDTSEPSDLDFMTRLALVKEIMDTEQMILFEALAR